MMSNNMERLKIWQKLQNRFDYAEFTEACAKSRVASMVRSEFSAKVGILLCSAVMFPHLDPHDAYMEWINSSQLSKDPMPMPAVSVPDADGVSRGLGDTIAKVTKATGLDKLAEIYTKVSGKPCGCSNRQAALNLLFPYNIKEEI
jgi:hypothetical protein